MLAGKSKAKGRSQVSGGKRWALIGWVREAGWSSCELVVSRGKIVDRTATLGESGKDANKKRVNELRLTCGYSLDFSWRLCGDSAIV